MAVCVGVRWKVSDSAVVATGAQKFKDVYEAAQDKVEGKPEEKDEHADEAADLLDKLKVESKSEGAADGEEKEKAKPAVEEKEAAEAKAE